MPASSKQQQKFMGMVHALKKGDIKPSDVSQDVRDAAKSMKKSDAKDFASTKHKGLPKKVKQEILSKLKEYANKMGRDHLGGDDYTSSKKGGLRDFDGYDNVDYNKDMPMDEATKGDIMRAVKGKPNPYTLVVIKRNKVIYQKDIKNPQDAPAIYSVIRKHMDKGERIHIEDRTGKIVFKEGINEGFKSEYKGNDGIIWKKGKTRGGVTNFTPYYKGHNIDFGGHNFKTEKELKDFIKDYILSNQLYRKYRNESKLKGQLAGDSVQDIIKSIGSRFVSGEIKNTKRDGKTYIKLKDEKFGSGVVKILKSRFGIDAKLDYYGGKGKIASSPSVSFFSDTIIDESKGVPQNYMQGRTSDYHTALRGKSKDYSGGTNFKKTNHGQPDLENDEEDQETNQLSNKQIALKAESFDKVEHLKLLNLALRAMPGSQKQKEIIRKLNQVRKAGGMRPLKETSIIEYGQRLDLSFIEDEDARLDGTPEPKDAINRDLDEGTMIRMAGKLAHELLPKDVWYRHAKDPKKNKEFVKSVVKDLAQTLNRFYKSHNINVKIQEQLIRELGVWRIDHYTGSKPGTIVPAKMIATVLNDKDKEKKKAVERDLAGTLNTFWKRWKIPFRIDLNKKG